MKKIILSTVCGLAAGAAWADFGPLEQVDCRTYKSDYQMATEDGWPKTKVIKREGEERVYKVHKLDSETGKPDVFLYLTRLEDGSANDYQGWIESSYKTSRQRLATVNDWYDFGRNDGVVDCFRAPRDERYEFSRRDPRAQIADAFDQVINDPTRWEEYRLNRGAFWTPENSRDWEQTKHIVRWEARRFDSAGSVTHFRAQHIRYGNFKEVESAVFGQSYTPYFCNRLTRDRDAGVTDQVKAECRAHVRRLVDFLAEYKLPTTIIEVEGDYYGDNRAVILYIGSRDPDDRTYLTIELDVLHEI